MIAQAFAVVGGDQERRIVLQTEARQRLLEPPDLLVGEGHLAVVETAREAPGPGLGRLVGVVRIVEVQPEEDAALG